MGKAKIIYQNWIAEIGADPHKIREVMSSDSPGLPDDEIVRAVQKALKKLPPFQRELIERYYFDGCSCEELSRDYDFRIREIRAYLRQAIKSLKKSLNPFVKGRFGLQTDRIADCPICTSPFREEIEKLIIGRNPRETWKNVMKILRQDYGLDIKAPQTLISHKKYHIKGGL